MMPNTLNGTMLQQHHPTVTDKTPITSPATAMLSAGPDTPEEPEGEETIETAGGRGAVNKSANSGSSVMGCQSPAPSARARQHALIRPAAAHDRISSALTGPYSRWSGVSTR